MDLPASININKNFDFVSKHMTDLNKLVDKNRLLIVSGLISEKNSRGSPSAFISAPLDNTMTQKRKMTILVQFFFYTMGGGVFNSLRVPFTLSLFHLEKNWLKNR